MRNDVYEFALAELMSLFGKPEELTSGNGSRFKSGKKGNLTIYHAKIAPGNKAEVAFDISPSTTRTESGVQVDSAFVAELKALTGRDVQINKNLKWPRVGFATTEQVTQVIDRVAARLGMSRRDWSDPPCVEKPSRVDVSGSPFRRNLTVKEWVLENADGICEGCNQSAPFVLDDGSPFLEVHHVRHLANGGSDQITNAVAICPNCHRRSHLSSDRLAFTALLYRRINRLVEE